MIDATETQRAVMNKVDPAETTRLLKAANLPRIFKETAATQEVLL